MHIFVSLLSGERKACCFLGDSKPVLDVSKLPGETTWYGGARIVESSKRLSQLGNPVAS